MELIIAIAIFSIITVSSFGIFASILKNGSSAKSMQQGLEDMSLAMDYIVKSVRFSSYSSGTVGSSTELFSVKINQSNTVVQYCFNLSTNKLIENGGLACSDTIVGAKIIAEDVRGHFVIKRMRNDAISDYTTTVTIFMQKVGMTGTKVQSTVTLRDYQ